MVVFAAKLACEYRNNFKKDIILDLFCYRRRGHNEADDPSSTQPMMYQKIANHPSVKTAYQEQLISSGVTTQSECEDIEKKYR